MSILHGNFSGKNVLTVLNVHWTMENIFLKTKWLVFAQENKTIVVYLWPIVYLKDPKYKHNN